MKKFIPYVALIVVIAIIGGLEVALPLVVINSEHKNVNAVSQREMTVIHDFAKYPSLAGLAFMTGFNAGAHPVRVAGVVGCVTPVTNRYDCLFIVRNGTKIVCNAVRLNVVAGRRFSVVTAKAEPPVACGLA